MATLIEIIIIIIASPEKRVLNNLHCSQVDIGSSAKIIAQLGGTMLGRVAGEGTRAPPPLPRPTRLPVNRPPGAELGATRRWAPCWMPSEEWRILPRQQWWTFTASGLGVSGLYIYI